MLLTQSTVTSLNLLPGQTERIVFDERLPGFGLRIRTGDTRTWIVQYRVGRKQRRRTLGPVDLLLAGRAYAAAEQDLAAVKQGRDPQKEDKDRRNDATLGLILERFLESHRGRLKSTSLDALARHLGAHWLPLHDFSLRAIGKDDVERQLARIVQERGLYAANRARSSLSTFFKWAVQEALVDFNPVRSTKPMGREVARDRVLNDAELVTLWRVCRNDDYGAIVRLLLLTGQRRDQVGAMRISQLDIREHKWSVGDARAESVRDVPLSDLALSLVKEAIKRRGRETGSVFGRDACSGFSGWSKAKAALDQRIADVTGQTPYWAPKDATVGTPDEVVEMRLVKPGEWRLQDIRRTVEVGLVKLSVPSHVIDQILGRAGRQDHRRPKNSYKYSVEMRQAMNLWADYLFSLLASDIANSGKSRARTH